MIAYPSSTVRGRYYQIQAEYTGTKSRLFVQSGRDKKKTIELIVLGYKWTIGQKHMIINTVKGTASGLAGSTTRNLIGTRLEMRLLE